MGKAQGPKSQNTIKDLRKAAGAKPQQGPVVVKHSRPSARARVIAARREKAARAEDENFSVEFLSAARKVFEMIDVDESGTLEKEEVVVAIRGNKKVINFLVNCGNKNLQYLLVPARLDAALNAMDTDRDGHIDADEWCASEF